MLPQLPQLLLLLLLLKPRAMKLPKDSPNELECKLNSKLAQVKKSELPKKTNNSLAFSSLINLPVARRS